MLPCPSNIIAIYLPRKSGGFPRFWPALMCPPAPGTRGWRPRRARYLPALVMIISVPISWKRFQSSAPCRSTRGACGVGSGEPGLEPLGEPPGEAGGEAARKLSSQPPAERAEGAIAPGGSLGPGRAGPQHWLRGGGHPSAGPGAGRPGCPGSAAPSAAARPGRGGRQRVRAARPAAHPLWPRASAPQRETALPSTQQITRTHTCRCVCAYTKLHP